MGDTAEPIDVKLIRRGDGGDPVGTGRLGLRDSYGAPHPPTHPPTSQTPERRRGGWVGFSPVATRWGDKCSRHALRRASSFAYDGHDTGIIQRKGAPPTPSAQG